MWIIIPSFLCLASIAVALLPPAEFDDQPDLGDLAPEPTRASRLPLLIAATMVAATVGYAIWQTKGGHRAANTATFNGYEAATAAVDLHVAGADASASTAAGK